MTSVRRIPSGLRQDLASHGIFPSDLVLYINSTCNLRCKHCYVGNQLLDESRQYSCEDIISFVSEFGRIDRLTIVGGEPLLHSEINDIVRGLPYERIALSRITTNLTTLSVFDYRRFTRTPITLAVSIDGHTAEIHDSIRGTGTFARTMTNLREIVGLGYNVEITHTINQANLAHFWSLLDLCRDLGVKQLNLHKISLQGNALASRDLAVSPSQWVRFREQLERVGATTTMSGGGRIDVRFPILFATEEEFEGLLSTGQYHHHVEGSFYAAQGHRIIVYPDGRLYISSEAFGTESSIGDILTGRFRYNYRPNNELTVFRTVSPSITILNSEQRGDESYPRVLSVSYKRSVSL